MWCQNTPLLWNHQFSSFYHSMCWCCVRFDRKQTIVAFLHSVQKVRHSLIFSHDMYEIASRPPCLATATGIRQIHIKQTLNFSNMLYANFFSKMPTGLWSSEFAALSITPRMVISVTRQMSGNSGGWHACDFRLPLKITSTDFVLFSLRLLAWAHFVTWSSSASLYQCMYNLHTCVADFLGQQLSGHLRL